MAKESKKNTDRMQNLLASVTEDMVNGGIAQHFADDSLKVERILLDMVRPDPIQPRRVLPEQVHHAFHSSRLTPSQALREMVQIAKVAARQRGRPFSHILELLPNIDGEQTTDEKLSPEEQILRDLVNLAVTIRDDGQVNPLTVVDVSQGVTRQFRIETGERRYWATWLLRDFIPEYGGDGMIPCIVVPAEQSSAFRQAKENTARSGLSAIAMARQAALLLLTVHGYEIPDYAVTNDFYRQALELDLRGKREYTEAVLTAMGGIGRKQFSRYKALLKLSDEAMELADRHGIAEARLRYVTKLTPEDQVEMILQIVQFNLTRKQVKDLIEKGVSDDSVADDTQPPKSLLDLVKVMKASELPDPQKLADYLVSREKNVHHARARLQTLQQLLDLTAQHLID